ncbi:dynamin family protein [Effusibacillus consociatus]|uniref:Dynamin family protein n=1 Tax=Effusibacillus consociatus TaxID=1117041 RepID=A0ABV9Q0B8_9BACL
MKLTEIQTQPVTTSALHGKLEQLQNVFRQTGDAENTRKIKQLLEKLEKHTFILALCGHFSAGKSSMINRLMGSQVLPSSPIPTSANVVTIENGPSQAQVWRRDGSFFSMPLSELDTLREYAVNGEEIETIRIQHPTGFLPERVQVMDTPGIDSTDDAHRVATESALHLADIVLYVMDYNHVQSEVNFGFTKTLKDRGKAVWLVVNQIDKHNEFELPFSGYSRSVRESFAAWGIEPDAIFYTSLKESEHPLNQFEALQEALQGLMVHRESLLHRSIVQSALHLIEEHVQIQSSKKALERSEYFEILKEAVADSEPDVKFSAEHCRERVLKLQNEIEQLESLPGRLQEEMQGGLQSLIENATLTPFQTTELCGTYLESRRPGFRVGLLFAGNKTEQERERRLTELHADFAAKVTANLDWHFKDLLVKIPEQHGIHDEEYANAVYNLKIEITPQMLAGWVKDGALASREYMYQYAKDIASEVKSLYRRTAAEFIERAVDVAKTVLTDSILELKHRLEKEKRYLSAAEGLEELDLQENAYRNELTQPLEQEQEASGELARLYVVEQSIEEIKADWDKTDVTQTDLLSNTSNKVETGADTPVNTGFTLPGQTADSGQQNFKTELGKAAGKLREAADLTANIPGLQSIASHMVERAKRLEQNLFTVALFGAFSAGKSSFANAMMGDLVLPVSPNPTTATINKILPPAAEWTHGTVRVKIKSRADIMTDIKGSLAVFGVRMETQAVPEDGELDEFFAEALQLISKLDPEEIPPNAKPHFSFLKAVEKGFPDIHASFGEEVRVDLDTFRDYVAREEKACFVEWIELYYDCPLTRQGIMLIDTPGADSINARHTKVAFDYIKNADAVLFVTYYNHAFSNADREFLIQLGRVKDAFEMDKMFFLVNAADLAADEEELAGVVSHVRKNLISCGISMPRIYPVSSQMALLARLAGKGILPANAERVYRKLTGTLEEDSLPSPVDVVEQSGIQAFEQEFISFTIEELTQVAVQSAMAEIGRAALNLQEFIETAKEGESVRSQKRASLQNSLEQALLQIEKAETDSELKGIEKEVDELIYYVKKRVFLRYSDAYNESFSSSVLRDDVRDIKKVLMNCLQDLLRFLAFDLGQEMRATAVRVEKLVNRSAGRICERLTDSVKDHLPGCKLESYQSTSFPTPDFPEDLPLAGAERLTGVLSLYKNAKDFFERDIKSKLREELAKQLQEPVDSYLAEGTRILTRTYAEAFTGLVEQVKGHAQTQINEYTHGIIAALSMQVNVQKLERVKERLEQLR